MTLADDVTRIPFPGTKAKRTFAADVAKAMGEANRKKGVLARLADKTPRLVSGVYGKTDAISAMVRDEYAKGGNPLSGARLAVYDGIFTCLFARSVDVEKKFDYLGFAKRRGEFYGAEEDFTRLYQKGFRLVGRVKELRNKRQLESLFTEAEKTLDDGAAGDKDFLSDLAQMLSEVL